MFDARHPDKAPATADLGPRLSSLVPIKVPPGVLAKIGESFAGSLSALQRSLEALRPPGPERQVPLDEALVELARLEQFGVQIQELARVLGGDAPLARERIDIAEAARTALAGWSRDAEAHGASLSGPREPFELEINAPALAQLLDLALEYALRIGSAIDVSAGMQGMPAQPMLTIRVRRQEAAVPADEDFDEVHWMLFVQLGRALGLAPRRVAVGDTVTLMLGFPDNDAAGRRDRAAPSPALLPRTADMSGRRVLLVEPQDIARVRAHRVLREAGMRVDAVPSLDAARMALRDGAPDAVVTGIAVGEPRCEALLAEVRALQPRLRVIELVDDDNAFAFSAPGADSPARVGRADLERTLPSALAQELDAAWPGRVA